jgi:hypothetical protein
VGIILLRFLTAISPTAGWAAKFAAAVITVLVIYLGVAMIATLHPGCDQRNSEIRYKVFRDLLSLFRRGRRD